MEVKDQETTHFLFFVSVVMDQVHTEKRSNPEEEAYNPEWIRDLSKPETCQTVLPYIMPLDSPLYMFTYPIKSYSRIS